jgi:GNAT superfamily N-acetyltransferase
VAELRAPYDAGRIWVAQDGDVVVGYVMAEVLDGNAHVAQVSVDPAWSRRGTGRRLVAVVEDWGRAAGLPATTLTTFRDVPFNGPYYARLGYRELAPEEIGPELAATMAREAALPGIDADRRCAMRKDSASRRPG